MSFDLIPGPYGSVIFCDDIRDEIGGKTTLVGCYTTEIVVNTDFPVTLPKFGIACRLVFDKFEGSRIADIIVVMPDQTVESASITVKVPLDAEAIVQSGLVASDPDHPRYLFLYNLIGGPFRIQQPGMIQVFLRDQDRTIRIGVVRARKAANDEAP